MKKTVGLAMALIIAIIMVGSAKAQTPEFYSVAPADDPENDIVSFHLAVAGGSLGFASGGHYRVSGGAELALGVWFHLGQHWGLGLQGGVGMAGSPVAGESGGVLTHHAGVSTGYRWWGSRYRLALAAEYAAAHDQGGRIRVLGTVFGPRLDIRLGRQSGGAVFTFDPFVGPGWDSVGHLGTLWSLRGGFGWIF